MRSAIRTHFANVCLLNWLAVNEPGADRVALPHDETMPYREGDLLIIQCTGLPGVPPDQCARGIKAIVRVPAQSYALLWLDRLPDQSVAA